MPLWRPEAVLFDVNETLINFTLLRESFEQARLPAHSADLWLARVLRDGFAHAACGTFAAFPDLGRYHLLTLLGSGPDAHSRADLILDSLGKLPVHDDVPAAVRRLREAHIRLSTLTNGTQELSLKWLHAAGVDHFIEHICDVSSIMLWKPRREAYYWAANLMGVEIERMALISVHPWDIHGATAAGMMGAWLNRSGQPYPAAMNPPQIEGFSLDDVAGRLLELPEW